MSTNQTYEEKELLLRIAEGDEQAFSILYRSYVPRLEPFVRSITKDEALVTEVIQETFVRLWMNRERLAEVEFPKTYISKTVSYICFQYLRRQAKSRLIARNLEQLSPADNLPEERLALRDLEKTIKEGVSRLTPAQQKIYKLSREDGLKIPEIALRLGISPNTVKNTLVASLKVIRAYTEKAGYMLEVLICWLFF